MPSLFRHSVGAVLAAFMGLLVAGLLASAALRTWDAWQRLESSHTISVLAQADKVLFDAMLYLRVQRGDAQIALLASDAPRADIE